MPGVWWSALPYCGAPPSPGVLATRWNLDPVLIAALLAALVMFLVLRERRRDQTACFVSGWTVGALALVSPLCALSVSLFAARVGQHVLLTLVAAPLVAAGFGRTRLSARPASAALLFAVAIWFWHAPIPYEATFHGDVVYWAMHVSLFGSALWLWSALIAARRSQAFEAAAAGLASSVQMGLLGALMTLAPHPFYAPHLLTTGAWGLAPLQDQQLGGALMWIPGCLIFLVVAIKGLRDAIDSGLRAEAAAP